MNYSGHVLAADRLMALLAVVNFPWMQISDIRTSTLRSMLARKVGSEAIGCVKAAAQWSHRTPVGCHITWLKAVARLSMLFAIQPQTSPKFKHLQVEVIRIRIILIAATVMFPQHAAQTYV